MATARLDAKSAYVACSRGREVCSVHTPDKAALLALLPEVNRAAALDILAAYPRAKLVLAQRLPAYRELIAEIKRAQAEVNHRSEQVRQINLRHAIERQRIGKAERIAPCDKRPSSPNLHDLILPSSYPVAWGWVSKPKTERKDMSLKLKGSVPIPEPTCYKLGTSLFGINFELSDKTELFARYSFLSHLEIRGNQEIVIHYTFGVVHLIAIIWRLFIPCSNNIIWNLPAAATPTIPAVMKSKLSMSILKLPAPPC